MTRREFKPAACLSDDRERRVFLFFKLYLNATKFVLLSVFTLKGTFCSRICSKSRLKSAKSPHPVDVRRSKTSLLKLPMWEWRPLEYGLWDWQGSREVLTARTFRVSWRIDTIIFSKLNKPPSLLFALPQTWIRNYSLWHRLHVFSTLVRRWCHAVPFTKPNPKCEITTEKIIIFLWNFSLDFSSSQ